MTVDDEDVTTRLDVVVVVVVLRDYSNTFVAASVSKEPSEYLYMLIISCFRNDVMPLTAEASALFFILNKREEEEEEEEEKVRNKKGYLILSPCFLTDDVLLLLLPLGI